MRWLDCLTGLDLTYSRRLRHLRYLDWIYDAEFRHVSFLQDPVSTTTEIVQFAGKPPLDHSHCKADRSESLPFSAVLPIPGGTSSSSTTMETLTCGTRWTYAGGLSPLGQRVNFLPLRQLQPYLLGNAGFLASPRDIPSYNSSKFNFTFAFGGGFQFFPTGCHAWALDYQVHHLSNRALGNSNPGVDNQLVRLSYTFASYNRDCRPSLSRSAP